MLHAVCTVALGSDIDSKRCTGGVCCCPLAVCAPLATNVPQLRGTGVSAALMLPRAGNLQPWYCVGLMYPHTHLSPAAGIVEGRWSYFCCAAASPVRRSARSRESCEIGAGCREACCCNSPAVSTVMASA